MDNITLDDFLKLHNCNVWEGNIGSCVAKQELMKSIASRAKTFLEIGFNAGHSADIILGANPNLKLISFDLGDHDYLVKGKEYIDKKYPNRHTLILGDSTVTLTKYVEENPGTVFDVLFIDGGHDYYVANSDFNNCLKLANDKSIIIMDDTIYKKEWERHFSVGPTTVWKEACEKKLICNDIRITIDYNNGISYGYKYYNA